MKLARRWKKRSVASAIVRQRKPSLYLLEEIRTGLLESDSHLSPLVRGLFLVYRRREVDMVCHDFRLILAPNFLALVTYIGRPSPDQQTRLVRLQYPGQLQAAEQYFGCRLERAETQVRHNPIRGAA